MQGASLSPDPDGRRQRSLVHDLDVWMFQPHAFWICRFGFAGQNALAFVGEDGSE